MAGPPVAKTPHFALHRASLEARSGDVCLFPVQDAWVGVLIPKRWARRAVTRNTIRRQIYEVARLHAQGLPQAGWVVRLRSEFSRKVFASATSTVLKQAVRQELMALMARVSRPAAVAPAPSTESPHAV